MLERTRTLLKLLHVDDEPDILELAKMSLEMTGDFDVTNCASGADALHAAKAAQPDVLLLDVMMPGMSGPETLMHLRQILGLEHTPVFFMTARVSAAMWAELFELGAVDVIAKPFDPMTLGSRIKDLLKRHAHEPHSDPLPGTRPQSHGTG